MQMITRNVPDDLHRKIKVMAAQQGITINQFAIDALSHAAGYIEEPRDKEVGR